MRTTVMDRKSVSLLFGFFGACLWIVLSEFDGEASEYEAPLLGFQLFDNWQQTNQYWMFFIVPALFFAVPATTCFLFCHFALSAKTKKD